MILLIFRREGVDHHSTFQGTCPLRSKPPPPPSTPIGDKKIKGKLFLFFYAYFFRQYRKTVLIKKSFQDMLSIFYTLSEFFFQQVWVRPPLPPFSIQGTCLLKALRQGFFLTFCLFKYALPKCSISVHCTLCSVRELWNWLYCVLKSFDRLQKHKLKVVLGNRRNQPELINTFEVQSQTFRILFSPVLVSILYRNEV